MRTELACPVCDSPITYAGNFCGECGVPLLWEDVPTAPLLGQPHPGEARAAPRGDLWRDGGPLPYSELFPLRQWWAARPWTLPLAKPLLFFTLAPLALVTYVHESDDASGYAVTTALFGLYFALAWGGIIHWITGPDPVAASVKRVVLIASFTAFAGVAIVVILQSLPIFSDLYGLTASGDMPSRILGFLTVGAVEEGTKALPAIWLTFKLGRLHRPRDIAYLAAVSGLAFGVAEAVQYSLQYLQAAQHGLDPSQFLTLQLLRLTVLPFVHALWAATAGYYIGLAALYREKALAITISGIATAALLHGLYDAFSETLFAMLVIAATILLFMSCSHSVESIAERLSAYLPARLQAPGS